MNRDVPNEPTATAIPESAANAWAAVYIDVAEKLDVEEQQMGSGRSDGEAAADDAGEAKQGRYPPDSAVASGCRYWETS